MALAIFQDETTGFNDRAEALAAAAVAAFAEPTVEAIAAVDAERASLGADLTEVFGAVISNDGDRLTHFLDGAKKHLDDAALNPTLTKLRLAGETALQPHSLTANELLGISGFDPEAVTAAGVAGIAALESVAESLGITDPE